MVMQSVIISKSSSGERWGVAGWMGLPKSENTEVRVRVSRSRDPSRTSSSRAEARAPLRVRGRVRGSRGRRVRKLVLN